jgi:hypothetical protein
MKSNKIIQQYPAWTTEGFGEIHFTDFYMVKFTNNPLYTVDYLGRRCLSYNPLFLRVLLKIRDIIVRPFGLKTGDGRALPEILYFEKGSVLVYFHVWNRNTDTIVLEEKDKHLNFRIILQAVKCDNGEAVFFKISTLVHFNNAFGKMYFAAIRPFHNNIMKYYIKQLKITEGVEGSYKCKVA